jgi:two-component system nitrate/nitrite response regulator NarL
MDMTLQKTVALCETHPLLAEGVRAVLGSCQDLTCVGSVASLGAATDWLRQDPADILIVDQSLGTEPILEWLAETRSVCLPTAVVVWGLAMKEVDGLRLLHAGVRGILFRTATPEKLTACLRSVAQGRRWTEDGVFKDSTPSARDNRYPRSELTEREHQVRQLVEQGFRNREIAGRLGIAEGTVKIHLKHIFEKTGVNGRYGLALDGLKGDRDTSGPGVTSRSPNGQRK